MNPLNLKHIVKPVPQLVFASNNINKLKEVALLLPTTIVLKSLADINCVEEIPETQITIEGNALQKARFVYKKYKVNCFADDTGLEIKCLDGRPGVYSARYAGDQKNAVDNMNKVLLEMNGKTNRKACFKTVIALIWEGKEYMFEGIVNGTIAAHKSGSSGFGYDPLFVPDGFSTTFAEMGLSKKNKISHRSLATNKLVDFLNSLSL